MQTNSTTPQTTAIIQALWKLEKIILNTLDYNEVVQRICDGLLTELDYLKLGYRIIVLTLIDHDKKVLKRISLSQTEEAAKAQSASAIPFHQIDIPLDAKDNLLIKTIETGQPHFTHHWPDIFRPTLTDEQAIANQTAANIKTSMLYPVFVNQKVIGAVIFSLIREDADISQEEKDLIFGFCDIVGLAVQNARLYTSLEETSKKLTIANQKLEELDDLKDEFISVASHELRTPMTAIKSYLWLALNGSAGPLNDKQSFYLQRSYDSTDRLIRLVNGLLNVSRIESGRMSLEFTETDLNTLTREVVDEITPRADELGIKINVAYDDSLPPVIADNDKIKEVLINLIGNSLKFTSPKGDINVRFERQGDFVVTHVTDSGAGLTPEMIENLFQKFGLIKGSYRTNKVSTTQGTGLGLYICREILKMHQGDIVATSPGIDQGSTFSYSLPVSSPAKLAEFKKLSRPGDLGVIHNKI